MKIILSGGGTLGPVIPLLAIREALLTKYPKAQFIWVGTKNGPEQEIVELAGVPFFTIGAGKWRRYWSLWNVVDVAKIGVAFFQSLFLIVKEKPNLLISAGGFVSVPLHWAGALLGVPAWVHQQDVRVGLANRLMFPFAQKITTALKETADTLPAKKTEWLGNPCRDFSKINTAEARRHFNIAPGAPVVFALGGGTGSSSVNKLILDAITHWPETWHIIHLVGRERPRELPERAADVFANYHVYQFFTSEMGQAFAVADVVIARGGFGTLTELASLAKPAVILPMFGTHQEQNANWFAKREGIMVLPKGTVTGERLAILVKDLMASPGRRQALGRRLQSLLPRPEPEKIINVLEELVDD